MFSECQIQYHISKLNHAQLFSFKNTVHVSTAHQRNKDIQRYTLRYKTVQMVTLDEKSKIEKEIWNPKCCNTDIKIAMFALYTHGL